MNIVIALILPILYIFTLISYFFGMDSLKLRRMSFFHLIPAALGVVGAIATLITFYVRSSSLDSELKPLAREAFLFFAVPFLVCVAISLLSTFILYAAKKRPAAAISFSYCTAEIILLYAIMLSASTKYTEINVALFVDLLALSSAFICLITPALYTKRLSASLADEEFVKARKAAFRKKQEPKNERKRIRETKKRIKSGNNH